MNITLHLFQGEKNEAVSLIRSFWKEHNDLNQSEEDALADLNAWTAEGHAFYFIRKEEQTVGFIHMGSRGCAMDWLEDLFVLPAFQRQGIGTAAVRLIEKEVCQYSKSLYIEAAARNEQAIRLYHRLGYDCLNTVTIRKDFQPDDFQTIRKERLCDADFVVRRL